MRFPATLNFKPSRRLRAALFFAHVVAFASLLVLAQPWWGLLSAPFLAASLLHCWRRIEAPVLTLAADGGLTWQSPGGDAQDGQVLAGAVAFSWLMVLRVRLAESGQTRVLVVLSDSLAPADYRKLQVWLRWVLPVKPASASA